MPHFSFIATEALSLVFGSLPRLLMGLTTTLSSSRYVRDGRIGEASLCCNTGTQVEPHSLVWCSFIPHTGHDILILIASARQKSDMLRSRVLRLPNVAQESLLKLRESSAGKEGDHVIVLILGERPYDPNRRISHRFYASGRRRN
jgi:hypothetical protein